MHFHSLFNFVADRFIFINYSENKKPAKGLASAVNPSEKLFIYIKNNNDGQLMILGQTFEIRPLQY